MRYLLTFFGLLTVQLSLAQVSDDFSDGDFTSNPAWSGDAADFGVNSEQLQLNVTPALEGESYLSTSQTELGQTTWEFYFRLAFSPSGGNRTRIYLVSDNGDLSAYPDGYFILVGESGSGDVLRFYKRNGGSNSLLFSGSTSLSSSFEIWVQVTRDAIGNWQVNSSSDGIAPYSSEGASFLDATHTSTSHFGFWCDYTSSNSTDFYFDDISISTTPVVPSFGIESLAKEGTNSIRITFNQNVDQTTAETLTNYSLNYGFGNPTSAARDMTNLDEVLLTFATNFVNNDYTLNVDQVQNEAMDETINDVDQAFNVELQTPFRDIVINEIMADPNPVVTLPDAEFLELYNTSNQAINIGDFMIDARTIDDFTLESGSYVTLTTSANAGLFSGDVIGLSGLSLSNSGEALQLTDNLGNLVDSVSYTSDWYNDTDKDDGGYSLEQINPELTCSNENNWTVSADANGGTPGTQNAVYDNTPDATDPNLMGFIATDANTFLLTFDEPMDKTSLNGATYSFDNGITENGVAPISPGFLTATVDVTPDLASGVNYTITVTGATDCAGNAIQTNSLSFDYDTNPPALDRIVVRTSNQIDISFTEDINETIAETEGNYVSDHSGSSPTSAILNSEDATTVSLTFADEFVLNTENTLTISNLEDLQGNVLAAALTPTFTLSQQVDTIQVMGINLLDIYYKQNLDPTSAGTESNYFVDDGVGNPSSAFLDGSNDRLVHLAFANNFDDNKNLTLTISDVRNSSLEYLTTPDLIFVYDTSPPKLDTVKVVSSSSLEIVFTENVDEQSAESKENYEYENIFPIRATLAVDQKTVTLEFDEDFEREVVFELSIDEVKDLYNNEIKTKLKQEFVYDVFEPELDSIIVRSSDELILWFNENVDQTTAENITNYSIEGLGQPTSASLDLEFQHIVYLNLSSGLPETSEIDLDISAMQDQRGNAIINPISSFFNYDIFYLAVVQSTGRNTVQIEFNKIPDLTSKSTLINYSINGQSISAINFTDDKTATLTFNSTLEDNSENSLTVDNVSDQNSNGLFKSSYSFLFDSRISYSGLAGDRTIALEFEVELKEGQTLTLSDFTTSPSLGNCNAAVIDNEDPKILRLTFEEALVGDLEYTISWQNLINTFGNDLADYFTTVTNDQTAPSVSEHLIVDANTIWIKYSEPLNEVSAEFLNNYQITPTIGYPTEVKYDDADSTTLLEFSVEFLEGTTYELTLDNIEDLSDNALLSHIIAFTFEAANSPSFGDLIITEIMSDPTPEVGLPDTEYIEIYNTTDQTISLAGISIVDEGGSATIISGEIQSSNYIVLTSTSGASQFPGVATIGITSFPSLNNSGETVSIYAGETQIYSSSYTKDWYKDSDKEDGGWALEMIDLENPCGELNNWTASISQTGGTPGEANSAALSNPDSFGPEITTAIATSENSIELQMNEKLHPSQFINAVISISPEKTVSSQELDSPQNTSVNISLTESLEPGQLYEITINQVADCKLNIIQPGANSATFRLPEAALLSEVLINEVLFNPKVGGVDFVELYNNSDKAINLINWTIGDQLDNSVTITTENLILDPEEYMALTTDPAILNANYPSGDVSKFVAMSSFPSLSDAEDSVILINSSGVRIDEMKYQDDYHFNLLDDDDGVSLERVSFEAESTNPDSWKSAASTVGFATPGIINSQFREANQSIAEVSVDPQVFVPDNTGMNDYTAISYQLDQAGNFANVHIYSTSGVLVKTLAEGELLSTTGFFTWDGITNNGNRASVGYYVINFEIFDGQGNKSVQKETVVLGAKF